MTSRRYTITLINENTEAWIRSDTVGTIVEGSANVYQHVAGLDISGALDVLKSRGWEVENWT